MSFRQIPYVVGDIAMTNDWFQVDRAGLRELQQSRSKKFVAFELIANAWDQKVSTVDIVLERCNGTIDLTIQDDDPNGFNDLADAYTLFAKSYKKVDVTKRGRFNLGEKLVLALCESAVIMSTKGTIVFSNDGTRTKTSKKTKSGSIITCHIKGNKNDLNEIEEGILAVLPPKGIKTIFNGVPISYRQPIHSFTASLDTVRADEDGVLKPTKRKTEIDLYLFDDRPAMIYEMGIPICETGDKYHVNIHQKVPVQLDRENVSDAYLRTVRTFVMNEMFDKLTEEDATTPWALEASQDLRISDEAIKKSLDLRFSDKRVSYDPTDPEANDTAAANGFTVVHGRTLSKHEWMRAKESGAIQPAGQIFPTKPNTVFCESVTDWTTSMHVVAEYAKMLAKLLMQVKLDVTFIKPLPIVSTVASYGRGKISSELTFNITKLGMNFFDNVMKIDTIDSLVPVDDLLIHEFAHQYESSHKNAKGWDALTMIGSKLKRLALTQPEIFASDYVRNLWRPVS